jgi:hypothetical protein
MFWSTADTLRLLRIDTSRARIENQGMPPPETPLEMARRHVREGEARIVRQEALVAELKCGHLSDTLIMAQTALTTMSTALDLARGDLERLEQQQKH